MSKKKKLRKSLKRILRDFEGSNCIFTGLCGTSESVNGKRSHKRFLKLIDQFGDRDTYIFSSREDRIAWLKLQIKAAKRINVLDNCFCYEI